MGLLNTHLLNAHRSSQEFSCVITINTFLMTGLVFTFWKWLWEIEAECIFNCSVFNGPHVSSLPLTASLTHHQHLLSASSARLGSVNNMIGWERDLKSPVSSFPGLTGPGQGFLTQARASRLCPSLKLWAQWLPMLLEQMTTTRALKTTTARESHSPGGQRFKP